MVAAPGLVGHEAPPRPAAPRLGAPELFRKDRDPAWVLGGWTPEIDGRDDGGFSPGRPPSKVTRSGPMSLQDGRQHEPFGTTIKVGGGDLGGVYRATDLATLAAAASEASP